MWKGKGAKITNIKPDLVTDYETGDSVTREELHRRFQERERRSKDKAEADLEAYKVEDAAEKASVASYVPEIEMKDYAVGKFLCYDDRELPVWLIEGARIKHSGSAPRIPIPFFSYGFPKEWWALGAEPAVIAVRMVSGLDHDFQISRHKAEILLNALRKAWMGEPQ